MSDLRDLLEGLGVGEPYIMMAEEMEMTASDAAQALQADISQAHQQHDAQRRQQAAQQAEESDDGGGG